MKGVLVVSAQLSKRLLEWIKRLVKRRKGHVGFELRASSAEHSHARLRCCFRSGVEEGSLANARLANQHESRSVRAQLIQKIVN